MLGHGEWEASSPVLKHQQGILIVSSPLGHQAAWGLYVLGRYLSQILEFHYIYLEFPQIESPEIMLVANVSSIGEACDFNNRNM